MSARALIRPSGEHRPLPSARAADAHCAMPTSPRGAAAAASAAAAAAASSAAAVVAPSPVAATAAEAGVDAAGHMSGTACDGASAPPERCASVVGECWAHGIVVITTGVGVRPRARSGASVVAVVVETVAAEAHSAVR